MAETSPQESGQSIVPRGWRPPPRKNTRLPRASHRVTPTRTDPDHTYVTVTWWTGACSWEPYGREVLRKGQLVDLMLYSLGDTYHA